MKAHLEHLNAIEGSSFMCKKVKLHHFDSPFHFHPEYELTYIQKSEGQRFVGNHFETFYEGDLLLIGKDVPHCWKNENNIPANHEAEAIVVQFGENFLGKDFFYKPELTNIRLLLERSQRGIAFNNTSSKAGEKLMIAMTECSPMQRVIYLLQILENLASSANYTLLNAAGEAKKISTEDCSRINKIYNYIGEHFHTEISLKAVADLVCMTPSSFCRYFKKVSKKTLYTLVNEYRIELSKHKLIHTESSIATICYECGFQNVSNFNKRFREVVRLTPSEYRARFSQYLFKQSEAPAADFSLH